MMTGPSNDPDVVRELRARAAAGVPAMSLDEVAVRAAGRRRLSLRRWVAGGGAVTVALVLAVVAVTTGSFHPPDDIGPAATTSPASLEQQHGAAGCAVVSLQQTLDEARQGGASAIIATGTLSGTTTVDGEVYGQMVLSSIQTLSGAAIASGTTGWVDSARGASGAIPGADAGALWGPDGRLFAIVWPAQKAGTSIGPVLRIAPVVADEVIFSSAGCWDVSDLSSRPYQGALSEIPGSDSYARAAENGFHAVAVATVEHLAAG
jgi:hypothetical protein